MKRVGSIDILRKKRRTLPGWLDRALSIGIAPGDSSDVRQLKRLVTAILLASLPLTIWSGVQEWVVTGSRIPGLVIGAGFFGPAIALFGMWRWPSSFPAIIHIPIAQTTLISFLLTVMGGGLASSGMNAVWGFVGVLGAAALFADRRATFWLIVLIVSQVVASWWGSRIEPLFSVTDVEYTSMFNFVIVVLLVYFLMFYYVRQREALKEQSERLLRNILPDDIAERLKTSDDTIADYIPEASVLFADVVDFTPMSAGMPPADLVGLLDEVFSAFDELVSERSLEKIKTIGDAYMVAAGVPEPREDHAEVLCDLGLAVQEMVASKEFQGRRIRFRIGINSGPVVAGIIGTEKFSYDLWGDVVNTASRMESSGIANEIQITEETKRRVEHEFVCQPGGIVDVKGKGPMEVWTVVGRRPSAAEGTAEGSTLTRPDS